MREFKNDLILRVLRRQAVKRTPIWIMRQAGRYLPEYMSVRAHHDFLTMCKTPELSAQVTLQPVDVIGVDAAIIFSDILMLPEAMGMDLVIEEGKGGPRFTNPVRDKSAVARIHDAAIDRDLKFVGDAIRTAVEQLNGRVPLIGFCGSPWTMLAYMVEGKGGEFVHARALLYEDTYNCTSTPRITDSQLYLVFEDAGKCRRGCRADFRYMGRNIISGPVQRILSPIYQADCRIVVSGNSRDCVLERSQFFSGPNRPHRRLGRECGLDGTD